MRQLKALSVALPTSSERKSWQPSLTVAITIQFCDRKISIACNS
ncbi:hypothetical protein [Chroococcidiopsis sp [FACHB-1243]]|nr:hypothetical protein [Chroococcidiopsis sp. [FACHB-1243]]